VLLKGWDVYLKLNHVPFIKALRQPVGHLQEIQRNVGIMPQPLILPFAKIKSVQMMRLLLLTLTANLL